MANKVLNTKDLSDFIQERDENEYPTNFPHRDLWGKDDAILKWISVVREFKKIKTKKKLKVVDLGAGDGCTPHIIASLGHDVTAIDIANISHFCTNSLVKMILNDALLEIKEMEDDTVDVFIDVCAVTHFNTSPGENYGNLGWKNVADQVFRVLKPKGKFIISSDVNILNDEGEYIKPQKLIEIVESSGLKLCGEYEVESEETDFNINYSNHTLQVASFCFEKPKS
jgi:SAM-dependent methyltransferase